MSEQIIVARRCLKSPFAHLWNAICKDTCAGLSARQSRGTKQMKILILMALFCAIAVASRRNRNESAEAAG
jgi:hypothetical protein